MEIITSGIFRDVPREVDDFYYITRFGCFLGPIFRQNFLLTQDKIAIISCESQGFEVLLIGERQPL